MTDDLWAAPDLPPPPVMWKPPKPGTPRAVSLTPRQAQVLSGICHGHSNRQIGSRLRITEDTVKCHVKALLRALCANDRAHAAALAISEQVQITVRDTKGRAA